MTIVAQVVGYMNKNILRRAFFLSFKGSNNEVKWYSTDDDTDHHSIY